MPAISPILKTKFFNNYFDISASDPDGVTPSLSITGLPTGASFTDNLNGTGTFDWTPGFADSGSYSVTFTATDDSSVTDSEVITISVGQINQAPILAAVGDRSTDENVNLNFGVSASDPDGIDPILTSSALPSGASFVDNGNGTGTFKKRGFLFCDKKIRSTIAKYVNVSPPLRLKTLFAAWPLLRDEAHASARSSA